MGLPQRQRSQKGRHTGAEAWARRQGAPRDVATAPVDYVVSGVVVAWMMALGAAAVVCRHAQGKKRAGG